MSRNVTFVEDYSAHDEPSNTANQGALPSHSHFQLMCPNCGGKAIEQHEASGASICIECGIVVEENAIVSAVEFVEGAGGSSNMVGQFVSASSSKAYTGAAVGRRYAFSKDSRETTLANGRRRIQEVASRLRLGSHFVDAAHRLFTIAVEKNFVQGRRTIHVVAACLYIACRQEKSQHMLIDFSDALQVNVYTLGTCFLKFRRLLGLQLEIIDPALYIYRFAAHLDLDEKANAVSMTALRLVARMKRDWIVAGRRPAGICAAALLIAARVHGFSKHHHDVTRILKVCGMTVTSRVREFEKTPSARLTLDQFSTVELQREVDPPAYTRNKIQEARLKAIQDGNVELLTSGVLDDPFHSNPKKAAQWREERKLPPEKAKLKLLYNSLESELLGEDEKIVDGLAQESGPLKEDSQESEDATSGAAATDKEVTAIKVSWSDAIPRNSMGRKIMLHDYSTEEERQKSTTPVESHLDLESWKQGMPESINQEIDCFFRTEQEERQMEAIFNKVNKDYLIQQERKESERLSAEAAAADQEREDVAQAEGHARYRNSRRKRKGGAADAEQTTEDQLMAVVSARKVSRKINYDALSSIFDENGSFSTHISDEKKEAEDGMFDML
ncbi:transcription factor IIIB 90 kDa subunit [Fistulifera solaris]|jgi:transcription factor IIIB subunit 2|uniref:B-related factor 1 n=1 Tax=Fistulifera solaris TaxID=1519565 RepID=A0A1Z5JG53_FISSO|nr:transcription factor IIIB 90 kDa subunit [Fistulifera solaris]|eukprot:GAX12980.1 transcription factor IIIB 90 kDa subunit [Fistulifera solaris]